MSKDARIGALLSNRSKEPRAEVEWLVNAEIERLSQIRLVSLSARYEAVPTKMPALAFSNAKARQFAAAYCDENKGNDCPSGVFKADCTHFISHVLAAGGVVLDGPSHTCSKGLATVVTELHAAFINASEIYSNVHVRKSDTAGPGDFIFLLENLSAPYNHAMLLMSGLQSNGASVFGHTNQRCNEKASFDPAKCVFYQIEDHE